MDEPKPYHWSFDQSDCDQSPVYLTFSIGVYQWLPKASGKGLKKSKTIRVTGYVAEPERVYSRAQELCDQLNGEGVRIDTPPKWLQKQYSVPKPADLVIERIDDDLTGSQVRAARLQVMKRLLIPAGFVKGKDGTYVRKSGDQIHLIDFQAAMFGHSYTVNLGFHYSFLPGLFTRKPTKTADYHLLDCALCARIGHFMPQKHDTWFDYGNDIEALKETFVTNVAVCLTELARAAERWSDPQRWLTVSQPTSQSGWDPHYFLEFTSHLAIHYGRMDIAERNLEQLISNADFEVDAKYYHQLLKTVLAKSRSRKK